MRTLLPLVLALVLGPTVALADIGPPPTCPDGQHREYLYGHRCVQNGYHLELDEQGNPVEVKDAEPSPTAAAVSPAPVDPTPAAADPTPEAADPTPEAADPTPAATPEPVEQDEVDEPGGCAVSASPGAVGLGLGLLLVSGLLIRRR